jgi:tetratricopeptide (TPR) repeat protein
MKGLAPGIVLACISLILMQPVAAFGQQVGKGQFNPQANLQNAVAYCNRGYAKLRKGGLDGAIADCDQAIQLDPKLSLAYVNRGLAKAQKGDFDGAIADCDQAIQLDPIDFTFH